MTPPPVRSARLCFPAPGASATQPHSSNRGHSTKAIFGSLPALLRTGVLTSALLSGPASIAAAADPPSRSSGQFTLFVENDLFIGSDDNYSSGAGLSWVSSAAETGGDERLARKVVGAFSFLPRLHSLAFRPFLSFTLGQEIYTPTDIESPVAPPDQQPYAGVLFFDTALYSHGARTMHGYTVRVGCVGPCSGAEAVQTWLHERIGSPVPQGWDDQLGNEPLLNLAYDYHRRLVRRTDGRLDHDLTIQGGFGLGNYYTGANGGLIARVGLRLPDNYGLSSLRTGGASRFVGLDPPPGGRWQVHAFVGLQSYLIGRFLPTDGNTFRDSPSVEREDLIGNLAVGLVVGRGNFLFSWTRNSLAGFNDLPSRQAQDFGTFALSYHFGGR